jgi:hypothetical protein
MISFFTNTDEHDEWEFQRIQLRIGLLAAVFDIFMCATVLCRLLTCSAQTLRGWNQVFYYDNRA